MSIDSDKPSISLPGESSTKAKSLQVCTTAPTTLPTLMTQNHETKRKIHLNENLKGSSPENLFEEIVADLENYCPSEKDSEAKSKEKEQGQEQ